MTTFHSCMFECWDDLLLKGSIAQWICTNASFCVFVSGKCISLDWFCDGTSDCSDSGDEDVSKCSLYRNVLKLVSQQKPNFCQEREFQCTGKVN